MVEEFRADKGSWASGEGRRTDFFSWVEGDGFFSIRAFDFDQS